MSEKGTMRRAALWRNRLVLAGSSLVLLLVLSAWLAPFGVKAKWLRNPIQQMSAGLDADGMPLPPGRQFLAGTDNFGRDVLSRVLHGTRVSLTVGVAAMLVATIIGVWIGMLAGYWGGKMDLLLMRFTEMNMTLPAILLAVALAGVMDGRVVHLHPAAWPWHGLDLQLKRGMVSLFLIIGLVCWPGMGRVIRGQVLAVKAREFVQASRALGASDTRLILRHILPNLLPTVLVVAVMLTANAILLEAGLGYLGVGVPPPAPTWGSMIYEGQAYFITAPHLVMVPGAAIVLTVLAFNLLGQGLQEWFDPTRERRR
ncbi:MAG TPA: ABC transporter permease [Candidatus Dormibacteraeota bacterium]|nr:ABC transporter permease [Candidatus Dormibacteraeota bacterium]